MRIDIKEMVLEKSLFMNGVNFGDKLPSTKGHVEMYCTSPESNMAVLIYKGEYSLVKFSNATLRDPTQIGGTAIPKKVEAPIAQTVGVKAQIGGPEKFSAQVETPITNNPKKPGRPAKFQGEERQGE